MAGETLDLGHLYDDVDVDDMGGGHLYDGSDVEPRVTDDLLHRDLIVVQPMELYDTPYGSGTVPTGETSYAYCSFEPRINKNSTFSKNWAQDTTPQSYGGLREDSLAIVLAPEWHGDIHTMFWHGDDCYEVDGPPMHMAHSSKDAEHWNITARCIGHAGPAVVTPPTPPEGSRIWGT
ncbi:hypothetical protein BW14_06840 [Bifidobacterium sp. UTBIF-68]|uniref:hypothetical protein n=1 Tax=Bifidobacterium sp. UTBIF-68 TaxID=1465262 RepID=UPI0021594D77|nr:hypothetical protein [Bifidobacterium sp. UTBIF-68]TPF92875.1 hypothetical protein BW14_06840 [Bifidobacterium sp. UTBIF-68]